MRRGAETPAGRRAGWAVEAEAEEGAILPPWRCKARSRGACLIFRPKSPPPSLCHSSRGSDKASQTWTSISIFLFVVVVVGFLFVCLCFCFLQMDGFARVEFCLRKVGRDPPPAPRARKSLPVRPAGDANSDGSLVHASFQPPAPNPLAQLLPSPILRPFPILPPLPPPGSGEGAGEALTAGPPGAPEAKVRPWGPFSSPLLSSEQQGRR